MITKNKHNNNSGFSHSLWMEVGLPKFSPIDSNKKSDICIVGGGIVGLSCAYALSKAGKSVIVVDQGDIAGGQTARTTAHLTWVLDDRYYELENYYEAEGARLVLESHATAIDNIEKIVKEEQIDCDFERVSGYLFLSPTESEEVLDRELATIQKLGKHITKLQKAPLEVFDTGPCLEFPQQAKFHVLKYVKGLIKAIIRNGGQIFSNTHVSKIKDGETCTIKTTNGFEITSQSVIVATCTPVNNRFIIHTKQSPYRTYAIAALVPKDSISEGLYWDTADPYHYIRTQKHDIDSSQVWLIIGGEDHKTGQDPAEEAKYLRLERWAKKRFPFLNDIVYRWSGQVFDPIDGLAFIGKNPEDRNVYIATGDYGNGITYAAIAAMLIPDLILTQHSPLENLYKPSRKTFSAASEFVKENLNVAAQYADWFTPDDRKKIESLAPEFGIIIRKGIKKFAVYKDNQNRIHVSSAFCPHLGGCVRWNSAEKSWDCPCHGSRFDGCGKVITGPAISDLSLSKME